MHPHRPSASSPPAIASPPANATAPATTFPDHAHHRRHAQPPLLLLPPPSSFSLPCSPLPEYRRPCMSLGRRRQHRRRPSSAGSHHITLPFLLPTLYSPLTAALLCFVEPAGRALPPPASPRPPSLIVVNVVRPGFPARGCPKAATFPLLTGSSSPVLGSAATAEALSPPASHPPAEIPSPPPFCTRVEPSRTFSELSPRREFHTATVDGVFQLTAGAVVAGLCSDHRGFTPPSSPRRDNRRPAPPPSPPVWPPATAACRLLLVLSRDGNRRPSPVLAYLRGFDLNPTTSWNPNRPWAPAIPN